MLWVQPLLSLLLCSWQELSKGTGRHQGQIIQIQGLGVVVGTERDLGAKIPEARLLLNSYYLHEMLRKKFEAIKGGEVSVEFSLADQVFTGVACPHPFTEPMQPPEAGQMPNDSQQHAIDQSQSSSLTYVWGPPGTGKNSTVGRIVEAYVNRGLRVLVAVHANAAVDEVTEDIAETLKATSFYHQGQILRLGNPQKGSLATDYGMVLMDNVVPKLGASLYEEQARLAGDRTRTQQQLKVLTDAGNAVAEYLDLEKREAQLAITLASGSHGLGKVQTQLAQKDKVVGEGEEKLRAAENAGGLKRLLLGTNAERVRQERDRVAFERDALRRQLEEMWKRRATTAAHAVESIHAVGNVVTASLTMVFSLGLICLAYAHIFFSGKAEAIETRIGQAPADRERRLREAVKLWQD